MELGSVGILDYYISLVAAPYDCGSVNRKRHAALGVASDHGYLLDAALASSPRTLADPHVTCDGPRNLPDE
jgi:hypothetical protein